MPGSKPPQERIVSTYCYQCVAGPDLLTVRIQDGVATEINPNFKAAAIHPGGGKACVKAFGLVQSLIVRTASSTQMKRTNPKKGRNEDPGFVRISWDEALDLVAEKLKATRAKVLLDEGGFPRLAASFGGGGTPTAYMGTLPAFLLGGPGVALQRQKVVLTYTDGGVRLRRNGAAAVTRAVVAGRFLEARARGVVRAVLFTENPAARRAYEALGFQRLEEYGLVIFKN